MNIKSSRIDYPQIVSVSFLFVKPLFLFLLLFFSMKSCFFWYKHLFSLETMLSVLHQFADFQWMGVFCVTVRWFVSFEISNLNFGAAGACRPVGYRFSAKCCSVQLWVNWKKKKNETGSELIVDWVLLIRCCICVSVAARYQQAAVTSGWFTDTGIVSGQTIQPALRRTFDPDGSTPIALRNRLRPHGNLHQTGQTWRGQSWFISLL